MTDVTTLVRASWGLEFGAGLRFKVQPLQKLLHETACPSRKPLTAKLCRPSRLRHTFWPRSPRPRRPWPRAPPCGSSAHAHVACDRSRRHGTGRAGRPNGTCFADVRKAVAVLQATRASMQLYLSTVRRCSPGSNHV